MAKFYKSKNHYLLEQDVKYMAYSMLVLLLPVVLLWVVYKLLPIGWTFVGIVVFLLFLFKLSEPIVDFFKRKAGRFFRGWKGERHIKTILRELPDDWSVFEDVVLPGKRGDIDFVIVGPTGVYILEVKAHGGVIGYNGYALTVNGKMFRDKDFLRQTHGQLRRLKDFLYAKTGHSVYINAAVVFANDYATTHFGYEPLGGIYVLQKEFVLGLFHHFPNQLNLPRTAIESALGAVH